MSKEIVMFSEFAKPKEAQLLIDELGALASDNLGKDSKTKLLFSASDKIERKEYIKRNKDVKNVLINYCAELSGMNQMVTDVMSKEGLALCFSNNNFGAVLNTIISRTISGVILNNDPAILANFCNIENVDVGDSFTGEIETKGLLVAQRIGYSDNVATLMSETKQSITIVPKPYVVGTQIDYIRILSDTFDFGKEIARVAYALMYAQYKLVAGILFDSTQLANTPFYAAAFTSAAIIQMRSDLEAVNGGADVKVYGEITAFNKAGAISTTNFGFESQDEMIRNGYLGHAYGMDNIVLKQLTDMHIAYTTANLDKLLLIPRNKLILLSEVGSKPITLVREKFVRVKTVDANDNAVYAQSYSYFMSFEAGLLTQANYGIISVA